MTEQNYGNIGETSRFNPKDYPNVVAELEKVVKDLHPVSVYYKKDIFLSYVKDHSIRTEWIEANPTLVKTMTSGVLQTTHIEKLFEACRWNKVFHQELERFVKESLN